MLFEYNMYVLCWQTGFTLITSVSDMKQCNQEFLISTDVFPVSTQGKLTLNKKYATECKIIHIFDHYNLVKDPYHTICWQFSTKFNSKLHFWSYTAPIRCKQSKAKHAMHECNHPS